MRQEFVIKTTLNVSIAQIPVIGDVECNFEAISFGLDEAISSGADILLTPEGALSGYFPHVDQEQVEHFLGKLLDRAADNHVGLALGTIYRESADRNEYNQIRFYDKNGKFLGFHSKILKTTGEREDYAHSELKIFDFHGIPIGGLICNDLWANPGCTDTPDPHLTRQLAGMGAKIIFHAVNGGRSADPFMAVIRAFHESNLRLRAQAANLWIATVDNCFPFNIDCSAPSGIINPRGNWEIRTPWRGDHVVAHQINLGR
ncbi:MAG: carbon-nitrogen hydrolase family protein [Promethearchaeota archaeon]